MTSNKLGLLVIASALIVTVAQGIYFSTHLPDKVATHFGGGGNADGWMGKSSFLIFMVGMQFGLAAFLLGLAWIIRKLPTSMINIPHRNYWLREDRAEATLAWLQGMLTWITAITALLMVFIFQMTIQANLANGKRARNSDWETLP